MWIMLNDCFLSIVAKDCARDEVLVRARREGDIEKIFPGADVRSGGQLVDYHWRASVKREQLAAALKVEVDRIVYPNFKDSVRDKRLHDAYLRVWTAMAQLQPQRPFMPHFRDEFDAAPGPYEDLDEIPFDTPVSRKKRRSLRRGR